MSEYRYLKHWCHDCSKEFLLNVCAGDFRCIYCQSELIENITADSNPRNFVREDRVPPRQPDMVFFPMFEVPMMHFFFIHEPQHVGVPPAQEAAIDTLPQVKASQADECAVCREGFKSEATSLPCSHLYHRDCIKPWLQRHNSCPMCRQAVSI
mmetsp:Transcript_19221/g.35154  ORF Transcript_19221/g.35154 Transcript_19221/m.35154 type:complete len:153 (-) Transcript_19221:24-482(-)